MTCEKCGSKYEDLIDFNEESLYAIEMKDGIFIGKFLEKQKIFKKGYEYWFQCIGEIKDNKFHKDLFRSSKYLLKADIEGSYELFATSMEGGKE